MTLTTYIIKRRGKRPTEAYEPEKLHKSILVTCLSVQTPEGQAEATAKKVVDNIRSVIRTVPKEKPPTSFKRRVLDDFLPRAWPLRSVSVLMLS